MPVITVSRGTFSGGKELAECLAAHLDLECMSREVLTDAAREHSMDVKELADTLESPPSFLDRMGWDRQRYLAYLRMAICRHAQDNRMVYHGHGGHFLLGGISHVLRVLVIADLDYRVERAMRRDGGTRAEAETRIGKMDDHRRKWTRFLYGTEWRDPFQFDVTLNLAQMGVDGACEVVTRMVELPAFQPTPASRQALANATVAAAAEAALLEDRRTRLRKLEVTAENHVVTVRGVGHFPQDLDAVREVLSQVEGVKEVRTEFGFSAGIEEG